MPIQSIAINLVVSPWLSGHSHRWTLYVAVTTILDIDSKINLINTAHWGRLC